MVPWSLPGRPVTTTFDQRRGVAFIGSYRHAPNLDAARLLVERIMPLVHQQDPTIDCLLVGSHMPDGLRRISQPGIVPLGHVPDLAGVFDRVRLTVAPLRFGAGIKGKVLASLAAGVPCVCSPIAAEGIDLSGCTGADAAELAALILRMHRDAAFNGRCAEAGLRLIAAEHSAARVDERLARAIGGAAFQVRRRA